MNEHLLNAARLFEPAQRLNVEMLAAVQALIKYENDSAVASCGIQIRLVSASIMQSNRHNANMCTVHSQHMCLITRGKL